ncbi:prepilin peptidase [Weissella oryzae]|uniref:prepilin peptidase n=1 Tax=Weissella oryzae TaxID=1129792 RepID=UPI00047FC3AB|nr:prepilin peptidase [Weissella oryzae]
MTLAECVFLCLLNLLSFEDVQKKLISAYLLIIPWSIQVLSTNFDFLPFIIYLSCLIVNQFFHEAQIGNGDLDVIYLLTLFLNYQQWIYCLLIACLIAILFGKITQQRTLPFVPFLMIAYLLVRFV